MVGKVLDLGAVTIKKDIRELLDLSKGDHVRLTVEKVASMKKEPENPRVEL